MADVWSYFEIAGKLAIKRRDDRSFYLCSIAQRADGAWVQSVNGFPFNEPNKRSHAEFRTSKKIDYNAEVWVCRVRVGDGTFGMARPCFSCMQALMLKRVKKISYTISDTQFGVIRAKDGYIIDEKIYNRNNNIVPLLKVVA